MGKQADGREVSLRELELEALVCELVCCVQTGASPWWMERLVARAEALTWERWPEALEGMEKPDWQPLAG